LAEHGPEVRVQERQGLLWFDTKPISVNLQRRTPSDTLKNLEDTTMTLTPLTLRAKNRLRDHTLEISREGIFNGQPAVLTHCIDHGCGWAGWFTDAGMVLTECTSAASCELLLGVRDRITCSVAQVSRPLGVRVVSPW
jgi:hypothetical protein